MIFLEKVYTLRSFRFCGTDFHRSIALNEIICLPVFVLIRPYTESKFLAPLDLCVVARGGGGERDDS